jgi:hypothetical protein
MALLGAAQPIFTGQTEQFPVPQQSPMVPAPVAPAPQMQPPTPQAPPPQAPAAQGSQGAWEDIEKMKLDLGDALAKHDVQKAKSMLDAAGLMGKMEPGSSISVKMPLRSPEGAPPAMDRSAPEQDDDWDFVIRDPNSGQEVFRTSRSKQRGERQNYLKQVIADEGGKLTGNERKAFDVAATVVSSLDLPTYEAKKAILGLVPELIKGYQSGDNAATVAMGRQAGLAQQSQQHEDADFYKGAEQGEKYLRDSKYQLTADVVKELSQLDKQLKDASLDEKSFINMVQGALIRTTQKGTQTDQDWLIGTGLPNLQQRITDYWTNEVEGRFTPEKKNKIIGWLSRALAVQEGKLKEAYEGGLRRHRYMPKTTSRKGFASVMDGAFGQQPFFDPYELEDSDGDPGPSPAARSQGAAPAATAAPTAGKSLIDRMRQERGK